ncbi:MAG: glycogen synthase [Deltaproteobacteria bacterium]|nr:glycogen synthase [Deltaproteobacteria bacterium]
MNILVISSNATPDGSGDAICRLAGALPKALAAQDHAVSLVTPRYAGFDPNAHGMARRLSTLDVTRAGQSYSLVVYDGRTAAGVERIVLEEPSLFGEVESMTDEGDVALRMGVFAAAVEQLVATRDPRIEVAHGVGEVGALTLATLAASSEVADVARVLSFSGIRTRSTFDSADAAKLGALEGLEFDGKLDPLAAGLRCAGRASTLSVTYARELAAGAAENLGPLLEAIPGGLRGVLGGVDAASLNPVTDPHLPSRYDPVDLSGKARTKAEVQRRLELPVRPETPLLVAFGLDAEDGLELLEGAVRALLRNDIQLVVRGAEGDDRVASLKEAARPWPDRMKVIEGEDEATDHQLLAAADLLLAPHGRAPAGLLPMIAQRYGTLPVARATGAIRDFVIDCDAQLETGTGFLFDEDSSDALLGATQRAVSAFMHADFDDLRRRVMRLDHSWERTGRVYTLLYRELTDPEGE